MLKKTITFKDLDGHDVTEDFYFNLNKAEIAEMELSYQGGLGAHLTEIVESNNGGEIIKTFKELLVKSIGERSEDGRRFIKNDEVVSQFMQSDAYSVFFMELVTDANAASNFISAILPADLADEVAKGITDVPAPEDVPAYIRENREPTKQELMAMSQDELQRAFNWKRTSKTDNETSDTE